jgi:hypothetical protein
MISLMVFGTILAVGGLIMFNSVSKTTPPRHLVLEVLSGATKIDGVDNQYNVKLSRDETILISTGTGSAILSFPIEFIRDDIRYLSSADILEPIASMRIEGATTLRLKPNAINHSSGVLVIRCGSETEIVLYIEVYLD